MIPEHMLRVLDVTEASVSVDASDGSSTETYGTATEILGRIDQTMRTEFDSDGREIRVSEWRLYSNLPVSATSRVEDGEVVYEVFGDPWPVYDGVNSIHHYEATLRRAEG